MDARKKYKDLPDRELIERLRDGETEVMEYLLNKYKPLVKKQARTMYLIGGENDDLIQEGMIGLFKAVQEYDGKKGMSFRSFANLCIGRQLSTAIEASRRKKHLPLNSYISLYGEESDGDEEPGNLIDVLRDAGGGNPEDIILSRESADLFKAKLDASLSDFEQKVLYLHLMGTGYVKIAELLNKSPKAVDNAIQRIRAKAKKIMDGHL